MRMCGTARSAKPKSSGRLTAGFDTPEGIASSIYTGLPPALVPAAVESVLAHLIKLKVDRKARQDGDRWTLN